MANGLLNFFTSPTTALAAGLLQPTPTGSFGGGLTQGIQNALAAQRSNLRAQLLQQEIMRAQQRQQAQRAMAEQLGTRPTQFQADTFPGETQATLSGQQTGGLLSGGTGALADNRIDTEELRNMALEQLSLGNTAGANSVIGYLNATTPQSKVDLARLAADGDESAQEAIKILNGNETIKPLSHLAKINEDYRNGLITKGQRDMQVEAYGRSPGFKEQVMGPILQKMMRGEALTQGEKDVKDFFKTVDPFKEFFRAAMGGGTTPGQSNTTGQSGNEQSLLDEAVDAIQNKHKNPAAVRQRLKDMGVDPRKLDERLNMGRIQR